MRKADWVIGALIALFVLFGIFFFMKNFQSIDKQTPDRPSVAETLNQGSDGETATFDEEDDYEEGEYPDDVDGTDYDVVDPTIDDLADLNEAKAQAAAAAEAAKAAAAGAVGGNGSGNTPSSFDNNSSSANGNFLVVAGTFKQEINAEIQLKKFKQMGYANAEIGKFNKSTYASLIVNRFTSSAEANRLVKSLENKGIDAYVHEKR